MCIAMVPISQLNQRQWIDGYRPLLYRSPSHLRSHRLIKMDTHLRQKSLLLCLLHKLCPPFPSTNQPTTSWTKKIYPAS